MTTGLDPLEPTDLDHRLRAAEAVVREAGRWVGVGEIPWDSPPKSGSHRTPRWREPDSNHRSRIRKSGRCQVPAIRPGGGRTLTLGGGAESSLEGRDIELSVSPKDIRTPPY